LATVFALHFVQLSSTNALLQRSRFASQTLGLDRNLKRWETISNSSGASK
jgi:hypothetical protein